MNNFFENSTNVLNLTTSAGLGVCMNHIAVPPTCTHSPFAFTKNHWDESSIPSVWCCQRSDDRKHSICGF